MKKLENTKGPIFIVGAPRSGTTLLQFMLRSHPNISLPTGESHFIVPIYKNRIKYGDLRQKENLRKMLTAMKNQSQVFLETDLHGLSFDLDHMLDFLHEKKCSEVAEVFSVFFNENSKGEGKIRWGDKTPWYVLHMPLLLEMFPNAQIIHIIRDGRDVALSLFGRKKDFGVYNIFKAAEYWSIYLEKGQADGALLPKEKYLEVRYEDLLLDPVLKMKEICRFLGEPYTDKILTYKKPSLASGQTPLLVKPIQLDNAFKWKKKLSAKDQKIFEKVAWDILKRNGYETRFGLTSVTFLEKLRWRLHNTFCNLVYRKKWVGLG